MDGCQKQRCAGAGAGAGSTSSSQRLAARSHGSGHGRVLLKPPPPNSNADFATGDAYGGGSSGSSGGGEEEEEEKEGSLEPLPASSSLPSSPSSSPSSSPTQPLLSRLRIASNRFHLRESLRSHMDAVRCVSVDKRMGEWVSEWVR